MVDLVNSGHMHFEGTGTTTFTFGRVARDIYITTLSTNISFDGGVNFMTLVDGTFAFHDVRVKTIVLTGTSYSGIGIA